MCRGFAAASGTRCGLPAGGLRLLFYDMPKMAGGGHLHQPPVAQSRLRLFSQAAVDVAHADGTFLLALPAVGWYRLPRPSVTAMHFRGSGGGAQFAAGPRLEELAAERLQLIVAPDPRPRLRGAVRPGDGLFQARAGGLERVLYEVDEWLRFKSGETELTLRIKAVLGLAVGHRAVRRRLPRHRAGRAADQSDQAFPRGDRVAQGHSADAADAGRPARSRFRQRAGQYDRRGDGPVAAGSRRLSGVGAPRKLAVVRRQPPPRVCDPWSSAATARRWSG